MTLRCWLAFVYLEVGVCQWQDISIWPWVNRYESSIIEDIANMLCWEASYRSGWHLFERIIYDCGSVWSLYQILHISAETCPIVKVDDLSDCSCRLYPGLGYCCQSKWYRAVNFFKWYAAITFPQCPLLGRKEFTGKFWFMLCLSHCIPFCNKQDRVVTTPDCIKWYQISEPFVGFVTKLLQREGDLSLSTQHTHICLFLECDVITGPKLGLKRNLVT